MTFPWHLLSLDTHGPDVDDETLEFGDALESDEPGPEQRAIWGDLHRAMGRVLSPLERELLWLRWWQGWELRVVARWTNLSIDGARKRLGEAMGKLREELGGKSEESQKDA